MASEDTLEQLHINLQQIYTTNRTTLEDINKRKSKRVIYGHTYSLSCQLPPPSPSPPSSSSSTDDKNKKPWSIVATPVEKPVAVVLNEWSYSGPPLEEPENDVFNDNIDYTLRSFTDLTGLNERLYFVGEKYAKMFADRPEPRAGLRCFVNNLSTLRLVLRELNSLTVDREDKKSGGESLDQAMGGVLSAFQKVADEFSDASISMRATEYSGCRLVKNAVSFRRPKGLSLDALMTGHASCVGKMLYFETTLEEKPRLISCSTDKSIKVWDLTSREEVATLKGHTTTVSALAVFRQKTNSGGVKMMAASACNGGDINMWDLENNTLSSTIKCAGGGINDMVMYFQDGVPFLASGNVDKSIRVWNLDTLNEITVLKGHYRQVSCIATYKTGGTTYLVTGSNDNSIKVWDMDNNESGTCVATMQGHFGYIWEVVTYQGVDGICLASASYDKTIKLWSLKDYSLIGTLTGHTSTVSSVAAFLHNGLPWLVSGSGKGAIKLWNLSTMENITDLETVSATVNSLCVCEVDDKPYLIVGRNDIEVWGE